MKNQDRECRLRAASDAYYNGTPKMTDAEFDALWVEHSRARSENPGDPVWRATILNQVGAPPGSSAKARHDVPMLSLENAFVGEDGSLEELRKWAESVSSAGDCFVMAEPKIDGLSVRLNYRRGLLHSAVTRGDGSEGDIVTPNVVAAGLAPVRLMSGAGDCDVDLSLNAEVFMRFDDFAALNARQKERGGELYSNPRNAAAGSLRLLDPGEAARRGLSLLVHGVASGMEDLTLYRDQTLRLLEYGFDAPYRHRWPLSRLLNGELTLEVIEDIAAGLGYPTDGVVFKIDELTCRAKLGGRSRSPRWAVALKFQQEQVTTVLKGITVQVGRSGVLTPVAQLEPVEIDGSVVSRATLHNEDHVNRLFLCIGDRVTLRKAGAIIPEITGSVDAETRMDRFRDINVRMCIAEAYSDDPSHSAPRYKDNETLIESYDNPDYVVRADAMPKWRLREHVKGKCPACGSWQLSVATGPVRQATRWMCVSPTCTAQLAARIEHMAGRACLNLDQLGGEACDEIARRSEIKGVFHQFDVMTKSADWFASLSWTTESGGKMTFGESRAKKVEAAIRRARTLPLNRWIAALGIPSVGVNTSKEISRLCATPAELISMTEPSGLFGVLAVLHEDGWKKEFDELRGKYGISHHLGPVSILALVNFARASLEILQRIPDTVKSDNYAPHPPEEKTGALAGKTFVVTGTLSQPRNHFQKLIEDNGGRMSGSVSKSTDFLLAGDKAGSKLAKAVKLGVSVISETIFLAMLT